MLLLSNLITNVFVIYKINITVESFNKNIQSVLLSLEKVHVQPGAIDFANLDTVWPAIEHFLPYQTVFGALSGIVVTLALHCIFASMGSSINPAAGQNTQNSSVEIVANSLGRTTDVSSSQALSVLNDLSDII